MNAWKCQKALNLYVEGENALINEPAMFKQIFLLMSSGTFSSLLSSKCHKVRSRERTWSELSQERRREVLVVQLLTRVVVLHETGVGVAVLEGLRGQSEHRDTRCLFLFTETESSRYAITV